MIGHHNTYKPMLCILLIVPGTILKRFLEDYVLVGVIFIRNIMLFFNLVTGDSLCVCLCACVHANKREERMFNVTLFSFRAIPLSFIQCYLYSPLIVPFTVCVFPAFHIGQAFLQYFEAFLPVFCAVYS